MSKKTVKKTKHNYTSELELKSLLIRLNVGRDGERSTELNRKINKYIKWYKAINDKKYATKTNKVQIKKNLKEKIIELSEKTPIDEKSFEKFGEIILLMIKHYLTKPQFSGYTFKDEFYSDAVYKILNYRHNYNHRLISDITGNPVNAFSYITQYIKNSVLYVIGEKKKEFEKQQRRVEHERLDNNLQIKIHELFTQDDFEYKNKKIVIDEIKTSLYDELVALSDYIDKASNIVIYYPDDYVITFDEYRKIKPLLKFKVHIMRRKLDTEKTNERYF